MKANKTTLIVIAIALFLGLLYFLVPRKELIVKFDSANGTEIESLSIGKNKKIKEPETPEKEGYEFLYWELDGEKFDFDTKITKNITLVAKWNAKEYLVTFDSDGGSSIENQVVKINEKANEPSSPVKEGYIFKYWALNDEKFDFDIKITEDIKLVARWEKETISLKDSSAKSTTISPSKPKDIKIIYTVEEKFFQEGSPQVEVIVKKNGDTIKASSVYSNKGVLLGNDKNEFNIILVDRSEFTEISKVKLANGTEVMISK